MNINYIDCFLFLLLIFICLILYDSYKIVSFIKRNKMTSNETFINNKYTNNININQIMDRIEEKKDEIQNKIQNKIIESKDEIQNIKIEDIKIEDAQIKDVYDNYPDIEKNLFYYDTQPKPFNEIFKLEDYEDDIKLIDPLKQYLKEYKPIALELENKTIRGHNFGNLDVYPKITQFGGDLPLKNNEFAYAMAEGYVFKDSAAQ